MNSNVQNRINAERNRRLLKRLPLVLSTLLFIAIGVWYAIDKIEANRLTERVFSNGGFAVGTVSKYMKTGRRFSSTVWYNYRVGGKTYQSMQHGSDYSSAPSRPSKNDQFLVVYNDTLPSESRLLFAYPICDSDDFDRLLSEQSEILSTSEHDAHELYFKCP